MIRKTQVKIAGYFFLGAFLLFSQGLQAYQPPSSPELFDRTKGDQNKIVKNYSGMIFDFMGAVGPSLGTEGGPAVSYSGVFAIGYRIAIGPWDLWDLALEFSAGSGGTASRGVFFPFGVSFRFGYGVPLNYKLNFLSYLGVGGSVAKADGGESQFLPGGLVGFQFEFLVSHLFRLTVGPRFSIRGASHLADPKETSWFYIPELTMGFRLKL